MRILGLLCLLATIALATPANAEIYVYEDRHGNKIYTDRLDLVPAALRNKAKIHRDTDKIRPPWALDTPSATKPKSDKNNKKDNKDKTAKKRKQLEVVKARLDRELKSLLDEYALIKVEMKAAKTSEQVKVVNKKAVSFNTRFKAYQKKKDAYQNRLEAFEKSIKSK